MYALLSLFSLNLPLYDHKNVPCVFLSSLCVKIMSDIHFHCLNLMGWGNRLRALYPTDQILLARSTNLKLFADEVISKAI